MSIKYKFLECDLFDYENILNKLAKEGWTLCSCQIEPNLKSINSPFAMVTLEKFEVESRIEEEDENA